MINQLLSSADKLCKQFRLVSGPTKPHQPPSFNGWKLFVTLIIFMTKMTHIFKKKYFEKIGRRQLKHEKLPRMQRDVYLFYRWMLA